MKKKSRQKSRSRSNERYLEFGTFHSFQKEIGI